MCILLPSSPSSTISHLLSHLSPQGRKPQVALDDRPKARTVYSPLVLWVVEVRNASLLWEGTFFV